MDASVWRGWWGIRLEDIVGELSDYAAENRRHWDATADRWVTPGEQGWAAHEPTWGMFHVRDDQIPLLPADLNGKNVVELGCGTAYVSAWAARRGRTHRLPHRGAQVAARRRDAVVSDLASARAADRAARRQHPVGNTAAASMVRQPPLRLARCVDQPGGIEFVPTGGQWFALAGQAGFQIDDYREIQAPQTAEDGLNFAVTGAWAKQWPAEHAFWLTAC
jgi:hypothetical protein